ncbi:MAG: hypothetical protein DYH08_15080 [Actinobacteria bacterium ATB1]|nr:hypothetical protein [Actinobacteria bacterium ATB1]
MCRRRGRALHPRPRPLRGGEPSIRPRLRSYYRNASHPGPHTLHPATAGLRVLPLNGPDARRHDSGRGPSDLVGHRVRPCSSCVHAPTNEGRRGPGVRHSVETRPHDRRLGGAMNENRERDFIERQTNRDISRRRALDWMLKVGYSATAASFLAATATSCGGDRQFGDITGESEGFGESSDTLKIAVVAPFSGIGSFLGAVAQRSLDAAVQHVNSEGGIGGRKVELVTKDVNAADFQAAMNVYQDLAGQGDVAGIIWALTTHLVELQDRIAVDRIPIAVAFANLHDSNDLYPANQAMRPLFQFLIPDSWTMRVLADYCKNDRGYSRVAFVYDENLFADDVPAFEKTMAETGLSTTTITSYPLNNSNFAPQIQATEGAQALWFWGLGTDIANAVKQLADVEKDYTYIGDALSAKRPHLMGTQAALGEKKWAELAGAAAKAGTLTTWHVGGLIYLPTFQIRDWMRAYTNELPSGGEETPADAMYTIANAVKNAGRRREAEVRIPRLRVHARQPSRSASRRPDHGHPRAREPGARPRDHPADVRGRPGVEGVLPSGLRRPDPPDPAHTRGEHAPAPRGHETGPRRGLGYQRTRWRSDPLGESAWKTPSSFSSAR